MQCQSCGATGEGRFCSGCGAPFPDSSTTDPSDRYWDETTAAPGGAAGSPAGWPQPPGPPRSGPRRWPWVVLGLLALCVLGGVVWMITAPDNRVEAGEGTSSSATSTASSSPSSSSETSTPTTSTTTTTTTTSTSSSSSSSSSSKSAGEELGDMHSDSLDRLDRDGSWGVTLSAKYDGIRDARQETEDGSHVFHEDDILALHEELEEFHHEDGQVYLVTSDDLESTASEDYADTLWMTILDPGGLDSRRDAVAWCERAFPETSGDELQNACYPRQLTSP